MPDTRVLIVASDPLVRTGLAAVLAGQPGCNVVGQVSQEADLAETVQVYRPDAILWDWARSGGLEDLAKASSLEIPIVALISDERDAVDVYSAGVRGLVAREADAAKLTMAMRGVAEGLVILDKNIAGALIPSRSLTMPLQVEPLTPRERDVLQLMAQGQPNKSIARQLGISEHTVKFHINSILGKLHASSRTEAVILATRLGLVLL